MTNGNESLNNPSVPEVSFSVRRIQGLLGRFDLTYNQKSMSETSHLQEQGLIEGTLLGHNGIPNQIYEPIFDLIINSRESIVNNIDLLACLESNELRSQKNITTDLLIVGAGPTAAGVGTAYRKVNPDHRVIVADRNNILGGQFRKGASFFLNTKTKGDVADFPGAFSEANMFSDNSIVEVSDITQEMYPDSKSIGEIVAINLFQSAEAMLSTTLTKVEKSETEEYVATFVNDNGEEVRVTTKNLVLATGLGDPRSPIIDTSEEAPINTTIKSIYNQESFRILLAEIKDLDQISSLLDNGVCIGGAGDSGKIVIEEIVDLLLNLGLSSAEINIRFNGKVSWFTGSKDFSTSQKYIENNDNDRYEGDIYLNVADYLPSNNYGNDALVDPQMRFVKSVRQNNQEGLVINCTNKRDDSSTYEFPVGCLVNAAGYASTKFEELLHNFDTINFEVYKAIVGNLVGVDIALKLEGENIWIAGPAAHRGLSKPETYTQRAASIQRLAPLNSTLGYSIGQT